MFRVYLPDSSSAASRLESEDLTERGKLMEWIFFFSRQRSYLTVTQDTMCARLIMLIYC